MKKKNSDQDKSKKNLYIFIVISMGLLAIGAYLLLTYQPKTVAQKFYEDRKDVEYFQESRESQSNKKKAERNIFLQN